MWNPYRMFRNPHTHTLQRKYSWTNKKRTHVGWRKKTRDGKAKNMIPTQTAIDIWLLPETTPTKIRTHNKTKRILLCVVHCKAAYFARWEFMQTVLPVSPNIILCACQQKSRKAIQSETCMCLFRFGNIYIYTRVKLLPAMCVERRFALSHIRTLHVKYMFLKAHSYKYIYTYMYMNIYIYIYI